MKKICFLSLKGGTGKTTTATNVAAILSRHGKKVLAIDLDPQGYMTASLGESTTAGRKNILDVFKGTQVREAIRVTECGVHLLAADLELTTADLDMRDEGREYLISEAIQGLDYDVIVFDCCPFLGVLSLNALVAADELIIPTEPEFLALRGVRQLYLRVVQMVQRDLNPNLNFSGVVVTRFDSRKKMHNETAAKMEKLFKEQIFDTKIRTNVALSVAGSKSKPVIDFAPHSNGAKDYTALTEEIEKRYGL